MGGAFTDANATTDALPNLDGELHHPVEGLSEQPGAFYARPLRPAHVERLNRADVHTDAAVQTAGVLDLYPVAHWTPRPYVGCRPENGVPVSLLHLP